MRSHPEPSLHHADDRLADPSTSKTFDSNNDPELAEALRASLLPQENGITSTNKVSFGPATRSQYEQGKWDLVPTSYTQEIVLDPEPEDRKRDMSAPAFLKSGDDDNRLAALFTIYHEIPMMHEMFLDRANVLGFYGSNSEWWAGKPIQAPMMSSNVEEDIADFLHELQRLMAFLDQTERSYGSAEALANLPFVRDFCRLDREPESAVLEAYKAVFSTDNQAKIKRIFSRGVDGPEERNSQEFAILQLPLPKKDSYADTIYDLADNVLWDSMSIDLDSSPFLTNIGEVITFQFTGWDESKKNKVVVPAVWYPDRYLDSGRQAALNMRLEKHRVEVGLERAQTTEDSITYHELRSGKIIKVKDLLDIVLRHDKDEIEGIFEHSNDNREEGIGFPNHQPNSKNLSEQLQKLADRIDRKITGM